MTLGYAAFSLLTILAVPMAYQWFGFGDLDAISDLHAREQQEHDDMLADVVRLQGELASLENSRGAAQARTLTQLLNDFHEVIANRFSGKKLSASSYLGAARRVQNQVIQNLSDMVGIGHSIASLQRHNTERASLDTQQSRLDSLLNDNDKLFKALTDTSVEVANIQEIGEFERTETLARLKDLSIIARQKGT